MRTVAGGLFGVHIGPERGGPEPRQREYVSTVEGHRLDDGCQAGNVAIDYRGCDCC
jgi:hypothetical protein